MSVDSLNAAQLELQLSLGQNYSRYLDNMRDWFGQRLDKELFDVLMTALLTEEQLELHTTFMTLLAKHCSPPLLRVHEERLSGRGSWVDVGDCAGMGGGRLIALSYEDNREIFGEDPLLFGGEGETDYIPAHFIERGDSGICEEEEESEEEMEEDDQGPADWLFNVQFVHTSAEDNNHLHLAPLSERFPSNFVSEFQRLRKPADISGDPDVFPNITHAFDIGDRLNRNPHLRRHFVPPSGNGHQYLSTGATAHGKFLLKAWELGMDGVELQASNLIVAAVKEHIRTIVTAVIKERRAFRVRSNVFHSIGVPYPNPYLRQGHHLYENTHWSDSTKMVDVMQVPTPLPTFEERDRIAALEIAGSTPEKSCRFPSTRATLLDLLNVIENDPDIIPFSYSRLKLRELIGQNHKGYGGSFGYDEEVEEDTQELLPLCSY